MFVPEYAFTLIEHDPDRPWVIRDSEHRTALLEDSENFFVWARSHWPEPRWSVELDPWQLSSERERS
jgi:hypothetical protein